LDWHADRAHRAKAMRFLIADRHGHSPSTTFYNVGTSSGKTTYIKHIFANGEPVADVHGSTTTAKVYYIHDDALGALSFRHNIE
jgi:hypothetical protein